ncbi:MAG: MbnP family protein [Saprospiraceae bacterium]
MKIPFTFYAIAVILSISSCKDDKEGSFTLHFKPLYDGQPLQMFSIRPGTGAEQIQFTHLSFLIADAKLLTPSGKHDLSDIEYVDLSFDALPDAEEGYEIKFNGVPAESYVGVALGVGVPPDLNSKTPAEFASSHPLSKTGYYWQAWDSYIFMKIEGRLDTLGNGNFDTTFSYHTGSNDLYRMLEGIVDINVEGGKNEDLNIAIDYKELLEGINIRANPQNHNPEDTVQIDRIVNNLQQSIILFP